MIHIKVSREQSRQDKTQLKEEVEELRGLLDAREGEIKVPNITQKKKTQLNAFPSLSSSFSSSGAGEKTRDPGQEPTKADGGGNKKEVVISDKSSSSSSPSSSSSTTSSLTIISYKSHLDNFEHQASNEKAA